MKNQTRIFFADGLRARRAGAATDGGAITISAEMDEFFAWARRALVMAGPVSSLP